jgi:hypothetical protein
MQVVYKHCKKTHCATVVVIMGNTLVPTVACTISFFSHACKFDGSTVWRFWAQICWKFARIAAQETSAFQALAPSIITGQHSQSHFSPTKLYLCLLLQKLQIHTFYFLCSYLSSQRCTSEYKKLHPKSNLLL